jgi:signal transduction histidine kinase
MSAPAEDGRLRLELMGRLAGGLAHDVNNLLMIFLGNAEMLEDLARRPSGIEPARLAAIARTIGTTADRATILTRSLLALARRRPGPAERLQLHAPLAELVLLLNRAFGGRVTVALDLGAPEAEADLYALENAVIAAALDLGAGMAHGGRMVIGTRLAAAAGTGRRLVATLGGPGGAVAVELGAAPAA